MGYDTEFMGAFEIDTKTASPEDVGALASKINTFKKERHVGDKYPGIWLGWEVIERPTGSGVPKYYVVWDGIEKFYYYINWLDYLITHYFKPAGMVLNGKVEYSGYGMGDKGRIVVTANKIKVQTMRYVD